MTERPDIDDETLQRFFDEELPPRTMNEVRDRLRASEDASEQLRRLSQIRSMIRAAAEDASSNIAKDALLQKIRAGIRVAKEPSFFERLQVVFIEWFEHRKRVWVPMVTATAALVLVFGTIALKPFATPLPHRSRATAALEALRSSGGKRPGEPAAQHVPIRGSAVLEVDFGGMNGTVFDIEGAGGASVAVVWINDHEP